MSVKIGNCELSGRPKVIASVDRLMNKEEALLLHERGADIVEIRYDLFECPFEEVLEFSRRLKEWTDLPLIGTLRENDDNKGKRIEMFGRIIPLADCIDAEKEAEDIFTLAREAGSTTLIYSTHDFDRTPGKNEFDGVVEKGKALGADIIKIAAMPSGKRDVIRLIEYTGKTEAPLVTISMGRIGGISRIAAPLFGSLMTYGYVREAVAPGQLHFSELAEFIKKFY